MARQPKAIDYTSGTVSNSAVTLFEMGSALITSAPTGARSFCGTVEEAAVRARGDGTDPTGSEGQLIAMNGIIYSKSSRVSKSLLGTIFKLTCLASADLNK